MLVSIPKGFSKAIDNVLVNYSNLQKSKDKIMYILSLITSSDYDDNFTPKFNNTLSSKALIKSVGESKSKGYKTIIKFLIDNNFINKTTKYFAGKFCNRYEIIQIETGKIELYEISDLYFINKNRKISAKKLNFLRDETEIIRKNITNLVLPTEINEKYKLPTDFFHQEGVTQFCNYNNITEKTLSSGRVFNAITSMKKVLRHCFVHRDGSNLAEIDISAAQYYFISVDMMDNGFTDLNLNKDLAEGKFYENLMDELKYKYSRDDFKVYLQRNYFNIERKKRSSEIDVAIAKLYPNLKNYIEICDTSESFKKNFRTIGVYAQRLESKMMIENISNELIYANLWFVTIHDALLVKEQDADAVLTILQNELEVHCKLKTNNYKDISINEVELNNYISSKIKVIDTYIQVGELGSIKNFKTHCRKIINYLQSNNIEVTEENIAKYSKAPLTIVKKIYKEFIPNQNETVEKQNFTKVQNAFNNLILEGKKVNISIISKLTGISRVTVPKYLKQILDSNV